MNSIHNNDGNEKILHEDLDKLGRSYAELEQLEPPDLVDQAILNTAHRAVEKKASWMTFGWVHGLATTAVFVLAFSLILQQPETAPVSQKDIISDEPQASKALRSSKKRAIGSLENNAGAEPEQKSDMARNQPSTMASAPAIMAEKEESLRESDSINSEILQPSHNTVLPELIVQKTAAGDFDRSKRLEEVSEVDEATYMTEAMQEKVAEIPAESAAQLAAGIKQAPADPEQSIEEQIERIIRLKVDGDETWVTELATFKEQYPDFPLPEELSEQR